MSGELRTLTYVVKMDIGDGKTKSKDFRVTLKTMEQDASKASKEVDKLAKTIGDKYGSKVTTAIDQTRTVKNEINAAAREATRSEKAFSQLSREYTHLANRTGKTADEQEILNAQYRLGANATKQQRDQAAALVSSYQAQRNAANETQGSMRGLRGQAQNLGWQLQDVAVQAQMGTDGLIILGQQGSQLASGFGATGALIGAGIAVGAAAIGVISKAMGDSKEIAKQYQEEVKKLAGELKKLGETGEASYLDKVINADIALLKIRELNSQIINTKESLEESRKISDSFTFKVEGIEYKKSSDALERDRAASALLEKQLENLTKEVEHYKQIRAGATSESIKAESTIKDLIKQGSLELKLFGKSAEEIERYTLAKSGANGASLVELKRIQDLIEIKEKESEATQKQIDKGNEYYKLFSGKQQFDDSGFGEFLKTRSDKLDEQFDRDIRKTVQAGKALQASEEDVQKKITEITENYAKQKGSIDKEYKDQSAKLAKERVKIERQATKDLEKQLSDQAKMQKKHIDTLAKYSDEGKLIKLQIQHKEEQDLLAGNHSALLELEKHYADERTKVNGSVWEKMAVSAKESIENTDKLMADSLDRFVGGTADAFSNALVYSDNFGEAMSNVFKGAAVSMLSYFAELAIQQALSWAFTSAGESGLKGQEAASKSLINQGTVFEAGLNAFTATAKINPLAAPAAATAAIGFAQPLATASNTMNFAGVFDKGGMIPTGSHGIVSEYGDELVGGTMVFNNSQSPLSVTGREDTAKMMGGGNSNVTINANGNASPEAIARAVNRMLQKPNKKTDNAIYDSMDRGRKNKGKRFNA